MDKKHNKSKEPWLDSWPLNDLESVQYCPACGASKRKVMFTNLIDNVFRVALGEWTLWRCANCNSAYLDPRPTEASISNAYKNYYTHSKPLKREESSQLDRLRSFRRTLVNDYLNNRYGTQYQPANRFGSMFVRMLLSQREALDIQFRWLPKPEVGQCLLDVGCGNGAFLLKARDAGWKVVGIDFDSQAVTTARDLGLKVHNGSIEMIDGEIESYDVITLSHVIEHVHEPLKLLTTVRRMLKPNGTLYIETPNILSLGAKIFGSNWRGIESPRHLLLFSIIGLKMLLQECGFIDVELKHRRMVTKGLFLASLKLRQGLSPYNSEPRSLPLGLSLLSHFSFFSVKKPEFITLLARKPPVSE